MKPNDTPPPADNPKANNAAGAGCMARLVRLSDFNTPETHALLKGSPKAWSVNTSELMELARKLERERNELIDAVRNLHDVKGRYHTQLATERLFSLLENAKHIHPHPEDTQ